MEEIGKRGAADDARQDPAGVRQIARGFARGAMAWFNDDGPQLGAAVAFYSIFALAPALVIAIAVAGAVFGADAARGHIVRELGGLVGPEAAEAIEAMIASAWRSDGGGLAAVIGAGTLVIAATGVFVELRRALNVMLGVNPDGSSLGAVVRARVAAFALLLGFGFLMIVSLVLSAALAAFSQYLTAHLPEGAILARALDFISSLLLLSIAFALILRGLPDRSPPWTAVMIGAATSAILFTLGKHLVAVYLVSTGTATSYGAAGSFVVVIFWVYASTQVLLLSAAVGRQVAAVIDDGERMPAALERPDSA